MNILKADALLGLEFLQFLEGRETNTSSAIDFAMQTNRPVEFTYQVTRKLRRVGLINTSRGRKGGYAINDSVFNKMNMLQFYKSFGDTDLGVVSNTPIGNLVGRLKNILEDIALSDIVKGVHNE